MSIPSLSDMLSSHRLTLSREDNPKIVPLLHDTTVMDVHSFTSQTNR